MTICNPPLNLKYYEVLTFAFDLYAYDAFDFYDYKNKYQSGATEEICPARLSPEKAAEMGEVALRAHNALGLGMYSRLDFLMDNDGRLFCLEANALPGMTPSSLLPQEAKAAGINYDTLCEMIISSPI